MRRLLQLLWNAAPTKINQYRVVRRVGGFEPQQSYSAGMTGHLHWFPLDENGYWLELEAFSHGEITRHNTMFRIAARRAVLRAQAINQTHIQAA